MKENINKILEKSETQFRTPYMIIKELMKTFTEARAPQAAASLAYYAFFSLFPFFLVIIAAGSYFLDREQVYNFVTRIMLENIPVSTQLINENLTKVLDARGPVGIVGLLTLLWSASGVFTNLAYNINLAWPGAPRRNFLEKRLVGIGIIAALGGLFIVSIGLDSITNLGSLSSTSLKVVSIFGSWLTIFLFFFWLYRWVPTSELVGRATIWSALITAVLFKVATAGFTWYLRSSFANFQLVYGSLGAIVALLLLIYIVALIVLFGAHLSAAIDHWEKDHNLGAEGIG